MNKEIIHIHDADEKILCRGEHQIPSHWHPIRKKVAIARSQEATCERCIAAALEIKDKINSNIAKEIQRKKKT